MKQRHLINTVVLTTSVLLGACGGGDSTGVATEPETALESSADAVADASGDVVDNAVEATADAANAVSEGAADMMNQWQTLDWDMAMASAQEKWQDISSEELMNMQYDPEGMVALIQDKYQLSEDQARQEVSDWLASM